MNAMRKPMALVADLFEELPDNGHLPVKWTKVRCWGAKNAYTLIFLSFMFFFTWVIMVILAVTT